MALDIHVLENGRPTGLLYRIEHEQYMRMQLAINLFKKRTGIYIDEYGDTKFSSGLRALTQTLKECVANEKNSLTVRELTSLLAVLEEAERNDNSVMFIGD
jgi:hypothetical protein